MIRQFKPFTLSLLLLSIAFASIARGQAKAAISIAIDVTDKATGDPVADAEVSVQGDTGSSRAKTDAAGRCAVSITSATPRYLNITAKKTGYASAGARWRTVTAEKPLPGALQIALEPGSTAGGIVKDDQGNPVKGATVQLHGGGDEDGTVRSIVAITAKTDDKGKWTTDAMPMSVDRLWYNVEAPGFFTDNVYRNAPPIAELRAQTAVMTIQRSASVTGKVVDQEGKPVANASIGAGEEGWGDIRHRAKSGSDGTFTLKGIRPGQATFVVWSKDFAPEIVTATAPTTDPIEVKLHSGSKLRLHVVDTGGKPISGVAININSWRNNLLDQRITTDANGDALWNGAPADEIQINLSKRGLGEIRDRKVTAADAPISITMRPPTRVEGTVTDAASGEPIKAFKVTQGITWGEAQGINWMDERYGGDQAPKTGRDGKFGFTLGYPYPFHAVRIEADGYLPTNSRLFKSDEGQVNLEFKLRKGQPLAGILRDGQGKPIAGATVYLVLPNRNFQVENGRVAEWAGRESKSVETDGQGSFKIPPQSENMAIVCISDDGYARADLKAGTTPSTPIELKLQPWGSVEGVIKLGSKPGAGEVMTINPSQDRYAQNEPHVWFRAQATADAEGHFRFDRALPGPNTVSRELRISDRMTTSTNMTPITVEAGKTATISIGGTGRPVIGRVVVPSDFNGGHWSFLQGNVQGAVASTQTAAATQDVSKLSDVEKQKLFANWIKGKVAAVAPNPGNMRFYGFKVEPDGHFRIDDVPAGNWTAVISIGGPQSPRGWTPPIATANKSFTIPPMPTGRTDEPMDLGNIDVEAVHVQVQQE